MRYAKVTLSTCLSESHGPPWQSTSDNTGVHAARRFAPLATGGCERCRLGQAVDMRAPPCGRLRQVRDRRNVICNGLCFLRNHGWAVGKMRREIVLGSLASLLIVGCGSSDPTTSATVERDSAGIVIVENHGPYDQWRIAASPELRIGIVEGDSSYQFHRVQFAGRMTDGRIVVADAGSGQIRWFSSAGAYRSTSGRKGGGPGEFGIIGDVLLTASDTLIVFDSRNRRATWFGPDERYVREEPLREIPSGAVTLLRTLPTQHLAVAVSSPTWDIAHADFNYTRDTLGVLLHRNDQIDTLAWLPGTESALWVMFSGGEPTRMQQFGMPFAHRSFAAGWNDRFALVLGDRHEIEFRDWTGLLTRISRRPAVSDIPITDEDQRRYVAHALESAISRGAPNPGAREKAAEDQLRIVPAGHSMPSFEAVLADSEGYLWLRDFLPPWSAPSEHVWTVYRPDGHVECRVTLPSDLSVMHVGLQFVTGVVRDANDVEYVVVFRLERAQ